MLGSLAWIPSLGLCAVLLLLIPLSSARPSPRRPPARSSLSSSSALSTATQVRTSVRYVLLASPAASSQQARSFRSLFDHPLAATEKNLPCVLAASSGKPMPCFPLCTFALQHQARTYRPRMAATPSWCARSQPRPCTRPARDSQVQHKERLFPWYTTDVLMITVLVFRFASEWPHRASRCVTGLMLALPPVCVRGVLVLAVSTGSIFGSISIGSVVGDPQQLLSYLFQGFASTFLPGISITAQVVNGSVSTLSVLLGALPLRRSGQCTL